MTRAQANILLLVAGLAWGGGFIAQSTAMDDIGPFQFMMLRFALATLAVVPLALRERSLAASGPSLTRRQWLSVILVGMVFFTAMAAQQVGLLATSVTNAGVLTGLYVVLTPIILRVFFREIQPTVIWPASIVSFIGIWMLGGGGFDQLTWGDWLVLIGAVFAALHVIIVGIAVTDFHRPMLLACTQFTVCALCSALAFLLCLSIEAEFEPAMQWSTLIATAPEVLYAAFVAGAFAFTLMAVCQQYTRAADAAVLLSSESLFAALGGAILLGERLSQLGYLGCLLLFCSIVVVSVVSSRAVEKPEFS